MNFSSIPRFLLILLVALLTPACLVRTLTIKTEPPGARVLVNHEEIGVSPITVPFTYGGKREFLLLHERGETKYKPLRVIQDVSDFSYDTFPFDVLVDIAPATIHDDRVLSFTLEESKILDEIERYDDAYSESLLLRAEELRNRAREIQEHGPPPAPPLLPPDSGGDEPADDGAKGR